MNKNIQTTEVKKRFKMYKAGKHWVVAPIVFLGVVGVVGLSSHSVSASEIPATTTESVVASSPQQVETSTADTTKDVASQPTKVVEATPVESDNQANVEQENNTTHTQNTVDQTQTNVAGTQDQAESNDTTNQTATNSTSSDKVNVPTKPVEISTPEQDKAVEDAKKDSHVTVEEQTEHLGALTPEQVAQKKAEIDAEQKANAKEIEQKVKDNQAANQKIAEDNAKKKAEHDKQLAEHERTKAEAEANKGKDGYLSDAETQQLLFDREKDSKITVDSKLKKLNQEDMTNHIKNATNSTAAFNQLNKVATEVMKTNKDVYLMKLGETYTVHYTLNNARYKDQKIASVDYDYTLKHTDSKDGQNLVFFHGDPTDTIVYFDYYGKTMINMTIHYYDENGKEIIPDGALLSFGSLNSTANSREYVGHFSGNLLEINGSSIKNHSDGRAYANTSNSIASEGSKHNSSEWDVHGSPLEYFGAIVGRAKTTPISFDFGSENRGYVWFALNSNVKTTVVTPKPIVEYDSPNEINISQKSYDMLEIYTPAPTKKVNDSQKNDINDKNVMRGDSLNYDMTWDLKGYGDRFEAKPEDVVKGVSFKDDYDQTRLAPQKELFKVTDSKGNDLSNEVTVSWDDENGVVTVTANDPEAFIKAHGDTELNVFFATKAKKDVTGDIVNTAIQNTFGNEMETAPVINHVPKIDPKKDVVVNVGDKTSINDSKVAHGSIINYQLDSSIRPSNFGGNTNEWSMTDVLSIKDQATGQNLILASRDFVLSDGTVIKAGTDISKYFTVSTSVNEEGQQVVTFTANQDFLDIMNLKENKDTEQGWSAFIQVKRVGYGDVENTFDESYNGETVNSNTVVTHTPEDPKEPEKPVTPNDPEKPVKPVKSIVTSEQPKQIQVATPAPEKAQPVEIKSAGVAELPKTGEDAKQGTFIAAIGGILSMIGLAGVGMKKKNKE